MCVKFPFRDLNSGPYPPHFTSTSIYRVTITPKIHDDKSFHLILSQEFPLINANRENDLLWQVGSWKWERFHLPQEFPLIIRQHKN